MRTMGERPVLLQRFPQGAGGPSFFQKRVPESAPEWLETTTVEHRQRHDVAGAGRRRRRARRVGGQPRLPRLPRVAAPGRGPRARRRAAHRPRPATGHRLRRTCARPPRELKALLDELGIAGFPKTTGNRGLHVYVRLEPRWDSYEVPLGRGRRRARARAAPPGPHHRRLVEGRARASGSSSTTTRTHRTRRCSARGRCAPARARRSRRRSHWDELDDVAPGRADAGDASPAAWSATAIRGRRSATPRSRSSPCWR